jgi:hypothetical protein
MLQAMQPDDTFIWLFGDDNFATFHNWNREKFKVGGKAVPDWQYIMNNFSVAVMHRPGYRMQARNSVAAKYGRRLFVTDPMKLGMKGGGWSFVNNQAMKESSTHIKQQLLAGQRNIRGLTPEIERHIYDQGLFNVRAGFNGMARPAAPANNEVRFPVFLLLAGTANLVKSVGAHSNAFDAKALLDYAGAAWDRSAQKGGFGKVAEAPGEIADCLISLYSLASALGTTLPGDQNGVTQWCEAHHPGLGMKARLQGCIEKLAELCVCAGLEKHRMMNVLRAVLENPDVGDMKEAFTRQYALLRYAAEEEGRGLDDILEDKMKINRAHAKEQSAQRLTNKTDIKEPKP